jgi:hypothetical protein
VRLPWLCRNWGKWGERCVGLSSELGVWFETSCRVETTHREFFEFAGCRMEWR